MASVKDLQDFLKNPVEFGIIPFWFLNHYPEEKVLRQQIRDFAAKNVAGVMVHARNGLIGGYLNYHWEEIFSCIIDEAKKNNIKVWLYDELNYPSGNAGKKVFEKYPNSHMQSLELVYESSTPPSEEFDKVLFFNNLYLGYKVRYQLQYPDYLDNDVTSQFVKLSYHWYAEKFGEYFQSLIPGEFTDNACGNFGIFRRAVPWTNNIEEKFFQKYNLSLDEVLPSLFFYTPNSPLHRLLFWRFFSELFLQSFVIKIEKECEKNGIFATGHYCLEHGLSEHARQIGDRFNLKEHQQLPGVDMLGRGSYEVLGNFPFDTPSIMLSLTSSPAYFFHDSRVLCESFGLTLHWQLSLAELRRLTGTLNALGVDCFVPHGFYYSISGHRKRECIPDFYHNTMFEHLGTWSLYCARLSALTSYSKHIADVAMFYPITSQQAGMELFNSSSVMDHGNRCNKIDKSMYKIGNLLVKNNIAFETINDKILTSAIIEDGELLITIPGGHVHHLRTIILPSVWIIEEESFAKLQEFVKQGGQVVGVEENISMLFTGTNVYEAKYDDNFYFSYYPNFADSSNEDKNFIDSVKANVKNSRVKIEYNGHIILREFIRQDGQYFAILHNMSREKLSQVKITCDFMPTILDIDTLECKAVLEKSFCKDFEYGETLVLTETSETIPIYKFESSKETYWIANIEKWHVQMNNLNTIRLNEMTCSYSGIQRIYQSNFYIESIPSTLKIALDIDPTESEAIYGQHPFYENGLSVPRNRCQLKVNEEDVKNISFGENFDHWIYEADILPFIKKGKNTIKMVQHCAYFETNNSVPEAFMLTGNFGVKNNKIILAPNTVLTTRWDETEIKNYSGKLEYFTKIAIPTEYRGKIFAVEFDNVYETIEVVINNVNLGIRTMAPWKFEIDPKLTLEEELFLQLFICNTPANCWEQPVASGFDGTIKFFVK